MMKVLMVISQFYPIIGGAERQAQLLANKLIQKGIEVDIVTGWWVFRTPRKEMIEGIRVHRNIALWGPCGVKGKRTLKKVGGLVYMVSLWIYLFFHGREYDIIHVHQALHPAFVTICVNKKFLRKPVIVKTASSGATSDIVQLRRIPFGGFQLRYLLENIECLVSVSKLGGREFTQIGFPESQIEYIPNGVFIPDGGKSDYGRMKQVSAIARLSIEKGIDVLLKAWAKVVEQEKGLKLAIMGDGPLAGQLKQLSRGLGVDDSVEFVGMVTSIAEYLRNADLFILPSRAEGLSNALLEAMAHGLPCIATNVGGNTEVLGEVVNQKIRLGEYCITKKGVLVNPDDDTGLAGAILHLLRNRREREEIGMCGRRHIQEHYSIDMIVERYIALYRRMVGRKS
jgi:glycosyltransferase involved in cell wall biosynthesis